MNAHEHEHKSDLPGVGCLLLLSTALMLWAGLVYGMMHAWRWFRG